MPDPFVVGGLIAKGVGLLGGLLGGGAEAERQKRRQQLIEFIISRRNKAIQDASRRGAGQVASSRQAALTRAAAAGRTDEAESYILPAEQRAQAVVSEDIRRTGESYEQELLSAEQDFADRPIEPSFFDTLGEVGNVAAEYGFNREALDDMPRGTEGIGSGKSSAFTVDPDVLANIRKRRYSLSSY